MRGEHWLIIALLAVTGLTGYYWNKGVKFGGASPAQASSAASAASPRPTPTAPPPPSARPTAPAVDEEQVGASHILIQFQGSKRSKATRTKEEAKALAEQIRTEASAPGADFAALAAKYSEEPNAAARKGSLGRFSRSRMVKPFADAAFALKVGDISQVVETEFGFHVIKRTE